MICILRRAIWILHIHKNYVCRTVDHLEEYIWEQKEKYVYYLALN